MHAGQIRAGHHYRDRLHNQVLHVVSVVPDHLMPSGARVDFAIVNKPEFAGPVYSDLEMFARYCVEPVTLN